MSAPTTEATSGQPGVTQVLPRAYSTAEPGGLLPSPAERVHRPLPAPFECYAFPFEKGSQP